MAINVTAKIVQTMLITPISLMLFRDARAEATKPTPPVIPKHSAEQIPIPAKAICHPSSSMATIITCSTTAIAVMMICHLTNVSLVFSGKSFSMLAFSIIFNSGSLIMGWDATLPTAILYTERYFFQKTDFQFSIGTRRDKTRCEIGPLFAVFLLPCFTSLRTLCTLT